MNKKKQEKRSKKTIRMDINAEYYDVILNILQTYAVHFSGLGTYWELERLTDIIRAFKNAEYYHDKTKT